MRRIADYLVYVLVRVFICVVQAAPMETCRYVSRLMATLCTDVLKIRQAVVEDNLRHAFPDKSAAERRQITWCMWEHLFLLLSEVAHAPRKIHDSNWRDYIQLTSAPRMVQALVDERPAVFVAAHYGNFELAGYVMGVFGFPTYTVARPLDNPYLDRFVNRFRGAKGQHMIPTEGSAQLIDQLLGSGGTLSVLADHYAGPKGCWVEFFGRPASVHKAVALFSLTNDAPLLVSYARRQGAPLRFEMGAVAIADPRDTSTELGSVTSLTQWYTHELEGIIRRAPQQYWWLHRRWKNRRLKPKGRAKAAA